MISTKHLVTDIKEVPTSWVFEHYGKLEQVLNGQTVVIHSLFKSERTPSMKIFLTPSDNVYFFKDFSTGKSGGHIKFVMELHSISSSLAINWILHDYNQYLMCGGSPHNCREVIPKSGFRVTDFELRGWNQSDKDFWTKFNIGTSILEEYNVKPLESFRMQKPTEDRIDSIRIERVRIYGYFKKDGTLYKIYQPGAKKKFINVQTVLQGEDQLRGYPNLLICSSLKDIMAVRSLKLKVDLVAPDSETQLIKLDKLEELKSRYQVAVMFDNDQAGIEGMIKYREILGVEPLLLPLDKDISDSIAARGPLEVTQRLVPLLDQVFNSHKIAA